MLYLIPFETLNRRGGAVMTEKVIIFGKAGWPYTDKARSAYGNTAKYFDVKLDSTKLEEMLKYSGGVRTVPVIVEGDKVTIGYGGSWGVWLPVVYRYVYLLCCYPSFGALHLQRISIRVG